MIYYKLSENIRNELLQYLNTRPHGEVRAAFDILMQLEKIQQKEVKKDDKTS